MSTLQPKGALVVLKIKCSATPRRKAYGSEALNVGLLKPPHVCQDSKFGIKKPRIMQLLAFLLLKVEMSQKRPASSSSSCLANRNLF
jgi:hypothetical protein